MPPDSPHIYLDFNATTPLLPEVVDAMVPYLRDHFGNPSSGHALGRVARRALENARSQVSELIGCGEEEVVFTSGGTEANNLALRGGVANRGERDQLVLSSIEHPAVSAPCEWLGRRAFDVKRLPVDGTGVVRLDAAQSTIGPRTAMVTVMHSNNETGVLQPIATLAELAHARGALFHTDAAQSVGKMKVNVRELGVDLLTIAGHKLYAPKGVGALYVKRGTHLEPLLLGAGHERGLRPGTENVASIVGFGVACARANQQLEQVETQLRHLRNHLWELLVAGVPGVAINGHPLQRLPNTLNVRFPGTSGIAVLSGAPQVLASTGSACHEGGTTASPVLLAMGIAPNEALGSVRFSVGRQTTRAEIEAAAAAIMGSWRAATRSR
jgi:cysteine desulfurase